MINQNIFLSMLEEKIRNVQSMMTEYENHGVDTNSREYNQAIGRAETYAEVVEMYQKSAIVR